MDSVSDTGSIPASHPVVHRPSQGSDTVTTIAARAERWLGKQGFGAGCGMVVLRAAPAGGDAIPSPSRRVNAGASRRRPSPGPEDGQALEHVQGLFRPPHPHDPAIEGIDLAAAERVDHA
jgi:hypothetical protein